MCCSRQQTQNGVIERDIDALELDRVIAGRPVRDWLRVPREMNRFARIMLPVWMAPFRPRGYGAERVPKRGPVILCPNHSSYLDPLIQGMLQPRCLRFMCKASMFKLPGLGWFFRFGGAFPVRRGKGDSGAMDLAATIVRSGQALFVYPEGTRFRASEALGPARSGAARLALATGAAVVPVATWGLKPRAARGEAKGFLPSPVTVIYGEPLHFAREETPTKERIAAVREEIWDEVQRLYAIARQVGTRPRRPRRFEVPLRDRG